MSLIGALPGCRPAAARNAFSVASVRLTCWPIERGVQCQVLALSRDVRQAPRDVTREASWHFSGVTGAQVSTTGIVEATDEGNVEINVDYQSQIAHCMARLARSGPGQLLAIVQGRAFVEDDDSLQPVLGVRIEVVSGPDAGTSATTGPDGGFALGGVAPGTFDLRATKGGYPPTELRVSVEPGDTRTNVLMHAPIRSDHHLRFRRLAGRSPREGKWSSADVRSSDDPSAD
jgi:hypothetical protein